MTDSSSFSSLLALVDSHLSKCSLQTNDASVSNEGMSKSIPIPPLNGVQKGLSDSRLSSPSQRLPLPAFSLSDSPINNVLAEQISNMLKAKAKKEKQEKDNLANKMKKLSVGEDDDFIDLMKAVQGSKHQYVPKNEAESRSSSPELFIFNSEEFVLDPDPKDDIEVTPALLPCKSDMSYILQQKVRKGRCSAFGKVLTARVRPVAAPYLQEKVVSKIKRFDFSTKSPCDCILEKLRRPTTYSMPNYVRFGELDVTSIAGS